MTGEWLLGGLGEEKARCVIETLAEADRDSSGYINIVQCSENDRRVLQEIQDQSKKQTIQGIAQGMRDAVQQIQDKNKAMKSEKKSYRYLAALELTPLLALLRRPGIFLLDDFGEWPPDNPARRQAMPQPLHELLVFLLRHPALLGGLLQRDLAALGGR